MEPRIVEIKLLVASTLSPAHNLLASSCRQITRISGNLILYIPVSIDIEVNEQKLYSAVIFDASSCVTSQEWIVA